MSSNVGLHSAHIYYLSKKRDHERAQRAYSEWLTKRAKTRQNIIDQIESIKASNPSKRSAQLLSRLEYKLAVMDSEDAEVADPDFLRSFPSAHKCHRPAYVKLAFENAIAATEKATKMGEDAYRTTLQLKEQSGDLPSYARKELEDEYLNPSPPSSPETMTTAESSKGPKQTRLQKLTAYLAKLESGQGMTKTFPTKPLEVSGLNNSRWAFRANTYYPKNGIINAQRSPSS